MKPLVFRADANSIMGTGHVMRCLALAQARQDSGGQVHYILATDAGPLVDRLKKEKITVHQINSSPGSVNDADQTAGLANQIGSSWIIADGYHFSAEYQKQIKSYKEINLLVLDDNHEQEHYFADIVLNANIYADESMYPASSRELYTKLYLGWKYHILRREFLKPPHKNNIPATGNNILVTMGGGDPDNATLKILQILNTLREIPFEIQIVVGANNPHLSSIKKFCARFGGNAKLLHSVDNMAELMSSNITFAISASGTTCYELIYMNIPFLGIIIADNQVAFATEADRQGLCINLGWHTSLDNKKTRNCISDFLLSPWKREEQKKRQHELSKNAFDVDWLLEL